MQPICPSSAFTESLGPCQRQVDAETHQAAVGGGVLELHLEHASRQVTKEKGQALLVIPHVGAGAVTATTVIAVPLPAIQMTVRRAEAGLRAQRTQIEQRRLFHDGRHITATEGVDELYGAMFQRRQSWRSFAHHVPGIGESYGVLIADQIVIGIAALFGVAGRPRLAVREVPGDDECQGPLGPCRYTRLGGEGRDGHGFPIGSTVIEPIIPLEIIPEVEDRSPPAGLLPCKA